MERSEDQKVAQSVFATLRFGKREIPVKLLSMRKSFAWRAKVAPVLTAMLDKSPSLDDPETLRRVILDSPEQMADAVFSYLELSDDERNAILDEATELELIEAFGLIMTLAFGPMLGQRKTAAQITAQIPMVTAPSEQHSRLH
jgi:hypothetical protein